MDIALIPKFCSTLSQILYTRKDYLNLLTIILNSTENHLNLAINNFVVYLNVFDLNIF